MPSEKSISADISLLNEVKTAPDLICFSHLRWDSVFQRPHHLLVRCARERRVFFIEETEYDDGPTRLEYRQDKSGIEIVIPWMRETLDGFDKRAVQRALVDQLIQERKIDSFITWYYNPRAYGFSDHLSPLLTIYDCMDDLASFEGAHADIGECERMLIDHADLVFTGGYSLYDARKELHHNIHPFPSSVDVLHFKQARLPGKDPADQAGIPHPRLGYFGVIDERLDYSLIQALSAARPDWQIVLVGPVVKVDPQSLPKADNIHYLGKKQYSELPEYLRGWDVALLPFALNKATRFISPTKTPEYLAGGKPAVSTPIQDVVHPYADENLVLIAEDHHEFIGAVEKILHQNGDRKDWLARVDRFLEKNSWDETWKGMNSLVLSSINEKENPLSINLESGFTGGSDELAVPPIFLGKANPGVPASRKRTYDYLVVGAGFAGSILAERLARGSGKRVLLVDRRPHIAGNAYDHYDDAGLLIHKYGPHIFHTNSKEVFSYLSQFTRWRPYEHRVRASVDGQQLPLPINLDTINRLYGMNLTSFEMEDFLQSVAEKVENIRTSEDVVINRIGRSLYEKFFRNYTRKQWDLDPSELDSSVTSRVPIRTNRDDRYFTDTYQAMPLRGYTRMFENMLDHPNIHIQLNSDYRDVVDYVDFKEVVYTGPIDEFFNFVYGRLPYRSLQFRFETLEKEWHQEVAVINYPNEHLYTRCTEFKHLTGQEHHKTSVVYEYPCSEGDPYYPVPRPENAELYKKYRALAEEVSGVYFCGRLATYKYYNMDQVAAQALTLYSRISGHKKAEAINAYAGSSFSIEMPCSMLVNQDDDD